MTRPKTKCILWTIAVLLALLLVTGMVLRRHEEPKIIGKISPADVSDISTAVSALERDILRWETKTYLEQMEIRALGQAISHCLRYKITSMEALTNGIVVVTLGAKTNEDYDEWYAVKEEDGWKLEPPRPPPILTDPITNGPPAS